MSSETEILKTNEFLRRRKLRLQQVREQSKDIAKKIRQRAKVEKLRQFDDLDSRREKEYLQKQEKLVKRLEQLYAQGVKSVGDSHKKAAEERQNETSPIKNDPSKLRGQEAVAELRRKKQEKLDEQKKLLDKKLLAREAANEISREKSSSVAIKLIGKTSACKLLEDGDENENKCSSGDVPKVNKADMATQWDFEEVPNEWEPNVPVLSLPKDDRESVKDSISAALVESKSDKSKRLDLFALSAEMPSSLRGGITNVPEDRSSIRPSVTLVSEYLQSRALRLRETDTTGSSKRQSDDLNNIKQTILRSRSSKIEGTIPSTSVCRVVDEQVIPVPSWQAESNCEFCTHSILHHKKLTQCRQFTVTNSQINEIFSSIRPMQQDLRPSPVVRGSSPFRRNKVYQNHLNTAKGSTNRAPTSSVVDTNLTKKNSVTMYNHSTRDSRDIPQGDSRLVIRDLQVDEDAYSQALKETTNNQSKDEEHQKRLREMRSKVAMTKQTVEKEYSDTMSFLNSLPKEKCTRSMKNAHLDERRQRILKVSRQQKLQQEFNKIEKECRKNCEKSRVKQTHRDAARKKTKSPAKVDNEDNFDSRDLQYSWMPVPESDGNLAIHTIPTTLKEGKSGNTVKFSKVDSYHEYRSRHKHTPPTKDTNTVKQPNKRVIETVIVQNDNESTDVSSISSDTSSVDNLNFSKDTNQMQDKAMSEADKIIIYKILDKKEKERKKLKLIDDVAKVLKSMGNDKVQKATNDNNNNEKGHDKTGGKVVENSPIDQVDEGVYKVVSEKGDNITSLYFSDSGKGTDQNQDIVITQDEQNYGRQCRCNKKLRSDQQSTKGTNVHCGDSNNPFETRTANCQGCQCGCVGKSKTPEHSNRTANPKIQPSAATSTSSFKTATTDKAHSALPDGGCIKLVDDEGLETGKFYIGASGFLKDDAYEVVIQLRKKDNVKAENAQKDNVEDKENVETDQDSKEGNTLASNKFKSKPVSEVNKGPEINEKQSATEDDTDKELQSVPSQTFSLNLNENKTLNNNNNSKEFIEEDQNSSKGVSNVTSNESIPNREVTKQFVDKGVHTSFQLSYAIPSHFTKTDNVPRPATSTYTQTTLDSPNTRPVFIHMSSSTSTAYMSPPEMVLPNFMRNNYDLKSENFNKHCENVRCTKKRCKCHKTKSSVSCKRSNNGIEVINPPPNTARENSDVYDTELDWVPRKAHERKNHKCSSKLSSGLFSLRHNHNKNSNANKISSRNLVMRVGSSTASSFKNKINNKHIKPRTNNPELNPTIKKYVNRLLALNRQGMKAIEVANQECSSVSTPGSSIIEIPRNLNDNGLNVDNKLSLEQMKNELKQKIIEEYVKENNNNYSVHTLWNTRKSKTIVNKIPKKRSVHRVKSLNISKRLLKVNNPNDRIHKKTNPNTSSPSSTKNIEENKPEIVRNKVYSLSNSSPTPRQYNNYESDISDKMMEMTRTKNTGIKSNFETKTHRTKHQAQVPSNKIKEFSVPYDRTTMTPDSELEVRNRRQRDEAMTISTQTSQDFDSEINLMKLAENKLQNMEKIADLTEKCTKRLSNLAKVLEEVRRNKSLAYSQISTSDTASDSDNRSDKNIGVNNTAKQSCEPANLQNKSDTKLPTLPSPEPEKDDKLLDTSEYVPFLTNIPKPTEFKYPCAKSTETSNTKSKPIGNCEVEGMTSRRREKPPPALSRIHLKHANDIVPHELSTVVEVDSPMSVKMKNQSSSNTKCEVSDTSYKLNYGTRDHKLTDNNRSTITDLRADPDLLQTNSSAPKLRKKISSTDSSDDSKIQMMDLKHFNELMLKPFISIQEFAKQCGDVVALDDGPNLDDIPKDDGINDELSSLHSDGSLPDVIAELLKRNIITEPFKFDTVSNVNSTTMSSESMMSVLALSKVKKEKKKSSVVFQNKGNASETSDSLSISSNPDLENAFKKLGMGWASSTLKKTKERLALSSSSNTSSSSLSQFKLKCLKDQDIPALVTDSVLSATKLTLKKQVEKDTDTSKNAEQQTSFMNSMTVNEFLTNELAKKITFTNKSNRNNTEEFVSLFETRMPEEMKNLSQSVREDCSVESVPSGQNVRARTSTPVQIFKSMTYHSSSSSNMSNGLFSNADDLSSVKVTSNSVRNHSTSDKDDLTIPNCSLKMRKGASDCSKSE